MSEGKKKNLRKARQDQQRLQQRAAAERKRAASNPEGKDEQKAEQERLRREEKAMERKRQQEALIEQERLKQNELRIARTKSKEKEDEIARGERALSQWWINMSDLTFDTAAPMKGGFGIVSKGKLNGTTVAIKKLLHGRHDFFKYMEREISSLAQLKHPNVVQFLGIASSGSIGQGDLAEFFIVTEFMDGGDLGAKLKDPSYGLNWKMCLSILRDLARSMVYIHGKGISRCRAESVGE